MKRLRAAIDIGTHTARLLIAEEVEASERIRPMSRKREYIYLAENYDYPGKRFIQAEAIDRTLGAIHKFKNDIKRFNVLEVYAIATGIIRVAENRSEFIDRIYDKTGIRVRIITGNEEAKLTAKGALKTLNINKSCQHVVFDLGGGTTEFFIANNEAHTVKSIPLGAMMLTKRFLKSDPPSEIHVDSLFAHVDKELKDFIPEFSHMVLDGPLVIGTGGTITTLAMILNKITPHDVSAEKINGLVIEKREIEALFKKIKEMPFDKRMSLTGVDQGRAGIIVAGTLVVMKILSLFNSLKLTVSMSDLLEGILFEHLNLS